MMQSDTLRITKVKEEYIGNLKSIWKKCFGDTDEYIDMFFEKKKPFCHTITAQLNQTPIGATYLMPVRTKERKGFYLYALGVLPEHRKKGIGQSLIKAICDYCAANDYFCMLSPASENLMEYYKKLGFSENAYISFVKYELKPAFEELQLAHLNANKFKELRDSFFENQIYWDKISLEYVLLENEFTNGNNLFFEFESNEYFAVLNFNEDTLIVKETNIPLCLQQQFSNFFLNKFSCLKAIWYLPDSYAGEKHLFGMGFNMSDKGYYLNHILN